MPAYGDGERTLSVIDRWEGGVGWLVHPEEGLARASHAVETEDGLWVLDPLDAPGLDELLAECGPVAGVAVCSSWHARDAGAVAARHDVPVSVPRWIERVSDRVDAPVERLDWGIGGFEFRPTRPLPTWQEAICWRERDGTLYVPESMGATGNFRAGDERLGVSIYRRLNPPGEALAGIEPERVLVGHGEGVFENATGELRHALANARRRAPAMFLRQLPSAMRGLWASRNH